LPKLSEVFFNSDELKLGSSLAIMFVIFAPIVVISLALARKPYLRAIDEATLANAQ
jgi:hypothetical protein